MNPVTRRRYLVANAPKPGLGEERSRRRAGGGKLGIGEGAAVGLARRAARRRWTSPAARMLQRQYEFGQVVDLPLVQLLHTAATLAVLSFGDQLSDREVAAVV